jgi:hypothetical protein
MNIDPSFIQVSRIVHQEKVQTAVTMQRLSRSATATPSLTARLISGIGSSLISIGRRLQASQQQATLQSLKPDASRVRR